MKRFVTVLLCCLLAIPAVLGVFPVSAAETDDSIKFSDEYARYLEKYSDFSAGESVVEFSVNTAVAEDGAVIKAVADHDGKPAVEWNGIGRVSWKAAVPQNGLYNLLLGYEAMKLGNQSLSVDLLIDGTEPYDGLRGLKLARLWQDDGDIRSDGAGNEFTAEQVEVTAWQEARLYDPEGMIADPYLFAFSAGEHTVTLVGHSDEVALCRICLVPEEAAPTYAEKAAEWQKKGYQKYSGKQIVTQGENATFKSQNSLISLSDCTSANVTPHSPYVSRVNYIGGNNWSGVGDTITWTVEVPQSALYELGFHYQQSYLMNGDSYRLLRIDGEIPFVEAKSLKFPYCISWQNRIFKDADGDPYVFYLSQGKHEISLSVTLGDFSAIARQLQPQIYELGTIYRQIVMITGETPDANRDYNLFEQIPDFEKRLNNLKTELSSIEKQIKKMSGSGSSSATSIINSMVAVINRMLKYKYQAQIYKSSFYDNYSSISAWMYEMTSMPMDIDAFFLLEPEESISGYDADFFKSLKFGFLRFCSSLAGDYNNISGGDKNGKSISLWINWGRDQAQVLNFLIQSDFTPKTGIGVDIKLTNASVIQGMLSGNGPDCYLRLSRTEPVNLAMRGALADLSGFDDFNEVCKRFMPSATVPYQFTGADGKTGTYALPDSQTFSVLFYRSDILKELNIEPPTAEKPWTWDDFIYASSIIMRNNMQVGLPYTQITDMSQVNMGLGALNIFPTILMQNGGSLYNKDLSAAELTSETAVKSFTMWTDFYNKYSFPKTYDFYNRFRIGLMPLAIQSYTVYTLLSGAASEIKGLWGIAPIPGVEQADGTVNIMQAGAGSGCSVMAGSSKEKQGYAWEFLKWWTSADIQYRFSQNVESILGVTGRNTPATYDAVKMFSWEDGDLEVLLNQWQQVNEMPEVPGGYYIPRVVDQAFWNVVNNNKSVRSMLLEWDKVADNEIKEKRSQYGLS